MKSRFITQSAVIATIYIVLSWIFAPISFGYNLFQIRISEVMTVLPIFTPSAIPGLFIGCALSNLLFGGLGIFDLILGSSATLISAVSTYLLRKKSVFFALLPPVIINAIVVGFYLNKIISPEINVIINILWVFLGQFISCYLLGIPLISAINKYGKNHFKF